MKLKGGKGFLRKYNCQSLKTSEETAMALALLGNQVSPPEWAGLLAPSLLSSSARPPGLCFGRQQIANARAQEAVEVTTVCERDKDRDRESHSLPEFM